MLEQCWNSCWNGKRNPCWNEKRNQCWNDVGTENGINVGTMLERKNGINVGIHDSSRNRYGYRHVSDVIGLHYKHYETHFNYTANVLETKLRSLLKIQRVDLKPRFSNWFTLNCTWEKKLKQIENIIQTEVPSKFAEWIDSVNLQFERFTAVEMRGHVNLENAHAINSRCERLQEISNEATGQNVRDIFQTLSSLFHFSVSYDANEISYGLKIAGDFLYYRKKTLDSRWMPSLKNLSTSCRHIYKIMVFMSLIQTSLRDPQIRYQLCHIPASSVTRETVLSLVESEGLARAEPEIRKSLDFHPKAWANLIKNIRRHTKGKDCGKKLSLQVQEELFDSQQFLELVLKIEAELEIWKPTSVLIVFGDKLQAEYIKTVLKQSDDIRRQLHHDSDMPHYGSVVNTAGRSEHVFVFSIPLMWRMHHMAELSYLQSRVTQSRILIAPGENPHFSKEHLRSGLKLVTRLLNHTFFEKSVGLMFQSKLEPKSEDFSRAQQYMEDVIGLKKNQSHDEIDFHMLVVTSEKISHKPSLQDKAQLQSLIANLLPVELKLKEPRQFLGVCTWKEKVHKVADDLQTATVNKFTQFVDSIQSHLFRTFVDAMYSQADNIPSQVSVWKNQYERLSNITGNASRDSVYNNFLNENNDEAQRIQKILRIAPKLLQFRDLVLGGTRIDSVHIDYTLCNALSNIAALIEQFQSSLELPETLEKLAQMPASSIRNETVLSILESQLNVTVKPELKSLVTTNSHLFDYFVHKLAFRAKRKIQVQCEQIEANGNNTFHKNKLVIIGDYLALSDFISKPHFSKHSFSDWTEDCNGGNVKQLLVMASESVNLDVDIDASGLELDVTIISPLWHVIGTQRIINLNRQNEKVQSIKTRRISKDFGTIGDNGENGNPDQNGGRFFGVCHEFKNRRELVLISRDGYAGQRGVVKEDKGYGGPPGMDANIKMIGVRWGQSFRQTFRLSDRANEERSRLKVQDGHGISCRDNRHQNLTRSQFKMSYECEIDRILYQTELTRGLNGIDETVTTAISLNFGRDLVKYKNTFIKQRLNQSSFLLQLDHDRIFLKYASPLALAEDLIQLEPHFYSTNNKNVSFEPIFEQILNQTLEYVRFSVGESATNLTESDKYILRYVYVASLTKLGAIRNSQRNTNVVNTDNYFDDLHNQLRYLTETTMVDIVMEQFRQSEVTLTEKERKAGRFIYDELEPAVEQLEQLMNNVSQRLLLQMDAKTENTRITIGDAEGAKQTFEWDFIQMALFSVVKTAESFTRFLMIMGKGADMLVTNTDVVIQALDVEPPYPGGHIQIFFHNFRQIVKYSLQPLLDDRLKTFGAFIEDTEKLLHKDKSELPDLMLKLKELGFYRNLLIETSSDEQKTVVDTMEAEMRLNDKVKEMESEIEAAQILFDADDRVQNMLKNLGTRFRVVKAGHAVYQKFKTLDKIPPFLDESIRKAATICEQFEEKRKIMQQSFGPIYKSIVADIKVSQSQSVFTWKGTAELIARKWKVKAGLEIMHREVKGLTKGLDATEEIKLSVEKLMEAMTLLIDLFEHIEVYEEKKQLVRYVANFNLPITKTVEDSEPKKLITKLESITKANLLLNEYQTGIYLFKKWTFPFGKMYLESDKSLADMSLLVEASTNKAVDVYTKKLLILSNLWQRYDSSTFSGNKMMRVSDFKTTSNGIPFFTWRQEDWVDTFQRLFAGEEVELPASLIYPSEKGVAPGESGFSAVKFTEIEFVVTARNASEQLEIDQLLSPFRVSLTHSGISNYQFGGHKYVIQDNSVTYEHRFQGFGNTIAYPYVTEFWVRKLQKQRGNFLMSPYTLWYVQFFPVSGGNMSLAHISEKVDLSLQGRGIYIDETQVTKAALDDLDVSAYYESHGSNP